jgi:leucyl-tRNA synthetase
MEYNFVDIEKRWQAYWAKHKTFEVKTEPSKPKYYVLDMFPYPSGAGLHVGHPLGYIASDIYSRYKRLKGFNVLHPMGFDAFGLPAEQYAIQTGQHPAVTTEQNIARYREQMERIGFSYDWSREVRTCDPAYYKWTQWAFLEMFDSYYCNIKRKARPISELIDQFAAAGTEGVCAACTEELIFSAEQWASFSEKEKAEVLMNYRIAYQGETAVNWCPMLGTVLANDEVKEGFSIRGGFPVEQKKMKQWQLRVSAYAERLLDNLEKLEWTDSLKEMQRNWIGRSQGAEMVFKVSNGSQEYDMTIFTTRADTIFGVTFMVLAPESEWVEKLTTSEQREAVDEYLAMAIKKTERERMAETHKVTGVFTGSYAVNPLTEEKIPVWISEYVLAGYGTGAIMAVPAHDSRDYLFAKHFNLPIVPLIEGCDISQESFDAKEGIMCNSGFLNGMSVEEAIPAAIDYVEAQGIGQRKINYRLRDAIFSRQRYWGEPFPIYFKDGVAVPMDISALPLELPEVDAFLPTESGEPPLARAIGWEIDGYPIETSTMPGFAGSSAYYLRYMDPSNSDEQSGIVNNTTVLYSNASEIMANQLNNVFRQLNIPLDLGFNYQPGEKGRDIFDVAVSTQLFNNRVSINGNIGNRQYMTSNQSDLVGDVDVEIKIDRTGRVRLTLFSHSADQYSNYLDQLQRNGIGVSYQEEFDDFRELFRKIFWSKRRRDEYAAQQARVLEIRQKDPLQRIQEQKSKQTQETTIR